MATTDIIFDVKTVDTQLADTYINTRSELHSIGFTENGAYEIDKYKNKIHIVNIDAQPIDSEGPASHSDTLEKLYNLAKLIEKNADLFCQLEYLIRGIPVDDVKKCDLKLITDNLLYCYKVKRNKEVYDSVYCDRIAFLADTPLAALGFIAQSLCCGCVNKKNSITIIANLDTAIICSLFVDLCRQVGFEEVFLQIVSKDADCSEYDIMKMKGMPAGCVGIVASKSDIDSAVDAFLSAGGRHPWRLTKIFVQECALERFESALSWKSERGGRGSRGADSVFSGAVALEAYRTVRELLALLGALRPLAASLWSADVAESLEIAHGLSSTLVWVNDLADFRGPPRVSQAFYSVVDVHLSTRTVEGGPETEALEALRAAWLARAREDREEMLTRPPEGLSCRTEISHEDDFRDSFIRVTGDLVVSGSVAAPRTWRVDLADAPAASLVTFLARGGGLLVKSLDADLNPSFRDILKIKGIPVVREGTPRRHSRGSKVLWRPCYERRVVWTNYGTTFAN